MCVCFGFFCWFFFFLTTLFKGDKERMCVRMPLADFSIHGVQLHSSTVHDEINVRDISLMQICVR